MDKNRQPLSRTASLPPFQASIAGRLLAAREAVMAPIRPHLRGANLTEQQWRILRVLNTEGASDASRLAVASLLYPPSVTRIIRELLERGLIARTPDPADGRRFVVSITTQGRELAEAATAETLKMLHLYTELFGAERSARLLEELRAFTETISAASNESVATG